MVDLFYSLLLLAGMVVLVAADDRRIRRQLYRLAHRLVCR